MRWHLALQQFTFGIQHVKGEENLGDLLSRMNLSDLDTKSLECSLESDLDACESGLLSVALTHKQEPEAKELYRVLFLALQDPGALKTPSFDKITKKKIGSYPKHVHLGEDGSVSFVTHLGEEYFLPKLKDREGNIKDTRSNGHFPMMSSVMMI
jgi:hypothetical protein